MAFSNLSAGLLDASVSFGRRTNRRHQSDAAADIEDEHYDFLALITTISELYSQEEVLEMQARTSKGLPLGRGGVAEVSTIYAALTSPSVVVAHRVRRKQHVVVIKQSESKLFMPNGQHNNEMAIRAFISEIRVLSHRHIRRHPNIVKILGIHWDYYQTGYPEPLILIEKAESDLGEFQQKHSSLPFATKKGIALDIARGLAELHVCGVIHGDLKPANVLVFYKPQLHAKIADFSHSVLDTGKICRLIGGTATYAAPEWMLTAPTGQLIKTDIYSYGILFSGLVSGTGLIECVKSTTSLGDLPVEEAIQKLKDDDRLAGYLYDCIQVKDEEQPNLHLEEFPVIRQIIEATLQLDPHKRDLQRVLRLLEGSERSSHREECSPDEEMQRIHESVALNAISIPYNALQHVSPVIMDQVVRALSLVANSATDTRRAAALMELAICNACDLTKSAASDYAMNSSATTVQYLLRAAEYGDEFARAIVHRISDSLGQPVEDTDRLPIEKWLMNAAIKGSRIALESLATINQDLHVEALLKRQTLLSPGKLPSSWGKLPACLPFRDLHPKKSVDDDGNTLLHWIASNGAPVDLEELDVSRIETSYINLQNNQGDTPVNIAARAGNFAVLRQLLANNATDASITNNKGENGLHFLVNFAEEHVSAAAQMLFSAGAATDAVATGFSGSSSSYLETRPIGTRSCPKLRAVLANKPMALQALLDLRSEHGESSSSKDPNSKAVVASSHRLASVSRATPASTQRLMLAWAARLHQVRILEVLQHHFGESAVFQDMERIRIWTNGRRYSLVELCILGYSSSNPTSGTDMPEKFLRMLDHGAKHQNALADTLMFFYYQSLQLLMSPCSGARNSLFFAIKEGRRDAANILSGDVFELFVGVEDPGRSGEELTHQLVRIDKEPITRQRQRLGRSELNSNEWSYEKPFGYLESDRYDWEVGYSPGFREVWRLSSSKCYKSESDNSYREDSWIRQRNARKAKADRERRLILNPPLSPLRLRYESEQSSEVSDPEDLQPYAAVVESSDEEDDRVNVPRLRSLGLRPRVIESDYSSAERSGSCSDEGDGRYEELGSMTSRKGSMEKEHGQAGTTSPPPLAESAANDSETGLGSSGVTGPAALAPVNGNATEQPLASLPAYRPANIGAPEVATPVSSHSSVQPTFEEPDLVVPARPSSPKPISKPLDYCQMGGIVDAALVAILHGQRAIFYDLVTGPGSKTVQKVEPRECYVYHAPPDRLGSWPDPETNVTDFFPTTDYTILTAEEGNASDWIHCDVFDGILQLPLLYMSVIARSVHRDIAFANILIFVLDTFDTPHPEGWTAKHQFEDSCLALDHASGQTTALFHAAALQWSELAALLMRNGASPGSRCFANRDRSTVLARLLSATENVNGEVDYLLRTAASLHLSQIIHVKDVMAMLLFASVAHNSIRWQRTDSRTDNETGGRTDSGLLLWEQKYQWWMDSNVRLWQSLAMAVAAQQGGVEGSAVTASEKIFTPVLRAAWTRDIGALQALLQMGFDPNVAEDGITALDCVVWTQAVPSDACDHTGIRLKSLDADMADLLRAYGAVRGSAYRIELHLGDGILQSLIIPCGVAAGLVYAMYVFSPYVRVFWDRALVLNLSRRAAEDDSSDPPDPFRSGLDIVLISGFIGLISIFPQLIVVAVWTENKTRLRRLLMLTLVLSGDFVLGALLLPNFPADAMDSEWMAGLALNVLIQLIIANFVVLVLFLHAVRHWQWYFPMAQQLGKRYQGSCPTDLVLAATYSPLLVLITPYFRSCQHFFAWPRCSASPAIVSVSTTDVERGNNGERNQTRHDFNIDNNHGADIRGRRRPGTRLAARLRRLASSLQWSLPSLKPWISWPRLSPSRTSGSDAIASDSGDNELIGLLEDFDDD